MKLGILGGTFNPVHLAHLRIAEEVHEACDLDRVLFIPAATPPHKEVAESTPFTDRLNMVKAAIDDNPSFAISDLEQHRDGPSYSVDTLTILRRENPENELFFIIGMDSFRDIHLWMDYRRLFQLAHIVVVSRPGIACNDPREFLPVALLDEFCYNSASKKLCHSSGNEVILLEETWLDISSTRIRQMVAAGHSIRYLVPAAVAGYIQQHGLYQRLKR